MSAVTIGGKWKQMRFLLFFVFGWQLLLAQPLAADDAAESKKVLDQWLQRQAAIHSWSADVVQIRQLKTLSRPLETGGHVWFEQPNRFRWQLGDPPRTIAVRTEDSLMIAYPRLKRVERYPLTGELDPAWRYVMALLDVGFPSEPQTFYATYDWIGAERSGDTWKFDLRPAAKAALRLIDGVRLEVSASQLTLEATQISFPDGSIMRNEFRNLQLNVALKAGLFEFEIPEGYQVVNPLTGAAESR